MLLALVVASAVSFSGLTPAEATAPLGNSTFLSQTQTQNLSGINGGASSANMAQSVTLNGKVYYIANNPSYGNELYVTDGTSAGTNLVKDIYTGSAGYVNNLAVSNGKLYFSAIQSSGTSAGSHELFISDGTALGTTLLKDINPNGSSSPRNFTEGPGGLTFFTATDETTSTYSNGSTPSAGEELWVTDGTQAGTRKVKEINPMTYMQSIYGPYGESSYVQYLTSCNGKMFFSASDGMGVSPSENAELWASDGTAAGTYLVKEINNVSATTNSNYIAYNSLTMTSYPAGSTMTQASYPTNLICMNNTLYFQATDGIAGYTLWKSDGTNAGTTPVKTTAQGEIPNYPSQMLVFNGKLYFQANSNTYNYELWVSDGTAAGTTVLKDIYPGSSSSPKNLTIFNGYFYFSAADSRGEELWKSDGTTVGTLFVKDINSTGSGQSSSPQNLYVWNNKLYFTANDGVSGRELWVTEGTGVTTSQVKDIFPGISDILDISNNSTNRPFFAGSTGKLIFTANSPIYGQEMWGTDGTEAGTQILVDANTLPGYAYAHDEIAFNGKIYFSAASAYYGQELWSTDLTSGNTQMVKDIWPGASSGLATDYSYFTIFKGKLYFQARTLTGGWELWSTDGTELGTVQVLDLYSSYITGYWMYAPNNLVVCNGKLFFGQLGYNSNGGGYALWAYDGVVNPVPLNTSALDSPQYQTCYNNVVYFQAYDRTSSAYYDWEVWKSDGTSAGTTRFYDTNTNTCSNGYSCSGSPTNFKVANSKLYFTASSTSQGYELFQTDGTTTTVIDIYPGASNSNPSYLISYKNELYFRANNGTNGNDLMSYDGTTLTPRDMVAGGSAPSMSTGFASAGGLLWFGGNTGSSTGIELNTTDGTTANSGVFEDLTPGSASTTISALTAVGNILMYNTSDTVMGSQPRFVVASTINTVTFDGNGSTGGSVPADIAVMAISATIPGNTGALTKTGFNFVGWNTSAAGTGTAYLPGATITPIVDTPLYAMWASVTPYTITYNGNSPTSGVAPPAQTNVTTMVTLDNNSGALAKTGFKFDGWNTAANGSGTTYLGGSRYTPVADVTLYAKWTALTAYTISFNVNGGTGSAPTTINTYATAIVTLPGQGSMVAPAGKTFAGWNTNAAGTGSAYAAAETLSPQATMTLYAQWTAIPASTLTYDANGATTGAVPSSLTATGTYVVIDSNTGNLFKTGYVFSGWNTQADGLGTTYQGTDNYLLSASVTLYAKWVVANYTVTFNGNANTGGSAPAPATGVSISTVLPSNSGTLVKAGYTFGGWNTLASGLGTNYAVGDTFSPTSSVTLYAKWTALPTYTITYSANGATSGGAPVTQNGIYSSVTLDNNSGNLAKTSFYFAGWNTQADGLGTTYPAGSSYTPTSSITLYALWSAVATYSLSYNSNGSTSGTAPLTQTGITSTATVAGNTGSLSRLGYRFDGWNTQANGQGNTFQASSSITLVADTVLYALWTSVPTYTITFNGNGQTSGSIPSAITSSDATVTLPGNTGVLNRTNFTFNGWNTLANGTGTHYNVGATFPLSASTTLYAEWLGNTYTLTYNANGADSGSVPLATSGSGALTTALNTGALAKAGYTFGGWNTAGDGTGTTVSAGATYTPSQNTTLFAKWNALPTYTITYNGNSNTGGTAPTATTSYASQTVAAPGTLARTGYGFTGWNTAANGSGTSYAAGSSYSASASVTLYAQWGALYDLTYNANGADGGSAPSAVTGVVSASVSSVGSLTKANYSFNGWNTAAGGTGTAYAPGATINLTSSVTLYAQWVLSAYSVTYSPNGSTSGSAPMSANSTNNTVVLDTNSGGLTKDGYEFAGWNTAADGSGTTYAPGATVTVSSNTIFYPLWVIPAPQPKFKVSALSKRKFDPTGGTLEISGDLLTLVEYVSLDGKKLQVIYSSDSKIIVVIAAHENGKFDLILVGAKQHFTYANAIEFIPGTTNYFTNVKVVKGKISKDSLDYILLAMRRNKTYTNVRLSFAEPTGANTQKQTISIKHNLLLLQLARQIVYLIDKQVDVSVQVTGNSSQIVLSFSFK